MVKESDVEMKDGTTPKMTKIDSEEGDQNVMPSVEEVLATHLKIIERAVRQKEIRTPFSKILRQMQALRRRLGREKLHEFVLSVVPPSHPLLSTLLDGIEHIQELQGTKDKGDSMEVDMEEEKGNGSQKDVSTARQPTSDPLPEVEIYLFLLVIMRLVDSKEWTNARKIASSAIERMSLYNRRTMDVLAARIWFYLSLAAERLGALPEIRSSVMAAHRAAVLRHDDIGQETLLNMLLRDYLMHKLYDQAEALRAKAQKDIYRSSQQHCRVLYYQGRICAVQLEYSDAKECLVQALRKSPAGVRGFRETVTKWLVVVRLLLGEIPERAELVAPELRGALLPYLELASAVRGGDVQAFSSCATKHRDAFSADGTQLLVGRLRANVIRAGLRRIAASYSRISLEDIAKKLGLGSREDAEFIVAKAIRDGGIAASIDHDTGVVTAAPGVDLYATDEPQEAFNARIAFCMDVHNEAQRAMRYDSRPHREWDDANALRERQDQELQAALEDDEMDF